MKSCATGRCSTSCWPGSWPGTRPGGADARRNRQGLRPASARRPSSRSMTPTSTPGTARRCSRRSRRAQWCTWCATPLDVVVSYAHHRQKSIDATMQWMNEPAAAEGKVARGIHTQLPQLLTTWSGHVTSWLDQEELPVHVARYEDLLADPMAGFGANRALRRPRPGRDAPGRARAAERIRAPRTGRRPDRLFPPAGPGGRLRILGEAADRAVVLPRRGGGVVADRAGPPAGASAGGHARAGDGAARLPARSRGVPRGRRSRSTPRRRQAEPARGAPAARGAGLSCTGTLGKSPGGRDGEFRASRPLRDYRAYGLWVRSPIPLPFVPVPVPPAGEPDVTLRIGATPEALPTPAGKRGQWETTPGAFLMDVPGVARYLVTAGRDILVEPRGGSDHDVRIFLTGSIFAALVAAARCGHLSFQCCQDQFGCGAVCGRFRQRQVVAARGAHRAWVHDAGRRRDGGGAGRGRSCGGAACLPLDAAVGGHAGQVGGAAADTGEGTGRYEEVSGAGGAVPGRAAGGARRLRADVPSTRGRRGRDGAAQPRLRVAVEVHLPQAVPARARSAPAHFRTITAMAKRLPVVRVARPAHPFLLNALADRVEEYFRRCPRKIILDRGPAANNLRRGNVMAGSMPDA